MNWLFIAVAAQIIIGSSAVFDKLLLRKRSIDPWSYAFWFGLLGLFAVLLLPFGYTPTASTTVLIALLSGAIFLAASFLTFYALEYLEASETLPLISALSPVITLGLSSVLLGTRLLSADIIGFTFLIASGLVLFLAGWRDFNKTTALAIFAASLALAVSYVTTKLVFNETSFITGFFWIKTGGVLVALVFLTNRIVRKHIFSSAVHAGARSRLLYFSNRGYAALGSIMVSGAIFLSQPALVDATQNIRYAAIFVLAWLLLRERFRGRILALKLGAVAFIFIGLGWLALGEYMRSLPAVDLNRPIRWGVTFSHKFSAELGLDWRANYQAVLDELKPDQLRLIAYWDEIESQKGQFIFDNLDWQIAEAEKRGIPYILAIGAKIPRWPECHLPDWSFVLPAQEQEAALHEYLEPLVERYRDNSLLMLWQVENEPFLWFGQCPVRSKESLEREVTLVRSFDPRRPILVTDGGEFGLWAPVARLGDVFGTTMYRKAYPRFIGPIFGVIEYPLAPSYFRVKERLVRWWNRSPGQRFIVIELQGEPWETQSLALLPYEKLVSDFSPEYFRDTIEYAKAAGFEEYYLWGAEWWFWMKEKHGDDRYWNFVKTLFAKP